MYAIFWYEKTEKKTIRKKRCHRIMHSEIFDVTQSVDTYTTAAEAAVAVAAVTLLNDVKLFASFACSLHSLSHTYTDYERYYFKLKM